MGWQRESQIIDTWMNELEAVIFDLNLTKNVLNKARRLLTKAVNIGLISGGHSATYVAFGCFCVACRMCGEHLPLDRMLKIPLWKGVKAERANRSVYTLLRRLGIRICLKCGAEGRSNEDFCPVCGNWLSRNAISQDELDDCLAGKRRAVPSESRKYFDYYGDAPRTSSSAPTVNTTHDPELPERSVAKLKSDVTDWFAIDNHFMPRGRKKVRSLFDALLNKIREFAPDVKPSATLHHIDLRTRYCGLYVGGHQLNINARGESEDPRFRRWKYNTPWGRAGEGGSILVSGESDLDESLMRWLRGALERYGTQSGDKQGASRREKPLESESGSAPTSAADAVDEILERRSHEFARYMGEADQGALLARG